MLLEELELLEELDELLELEELLDELELDEEEPLDELEELLELELLALLEDELEDEVGLTPVVKQVDSYGFDELEEVLLEEDALAEV